MCAFVPLRSFCGGYHAKKAWKCIALSNISIMSAILFADFIARFNISLIWFLAGEVILGIIIMHLSPVESCNILIDAYWLIMQQQEIGCLLIW